MSKPVSSFAAEPPLTGPAYVAAARLPSDGSWEASPALLRDGYTFIGNRRHRLRTDAFRTRLFFRETICLGGDAGARLFHDDRRFLREDDAPHRAAPTSEWMTPASVARLARLGDEAWRRALGEWESRADKFPLLPELSLLLFRTACKWTGLPLPEAGQRGRAADFAAAIDGEHAIGFRRWRGLLARRRVLRWLGGLVRATRSRTLRPEPNSPLAVLAFRREANGRQFAPEAVAAALFALIRPLVALDRFLVFCAHALHENPRCRERLLAGDPTYGTWFVEEVLRFYPLAPFAAARVKEDFVWRGHRFAKGTRALLDLYGTDHDETAWTDPHAFRPERFADADLDADPRPRRAEEPAVNVLMKTGAYFLAGRLDYKVPPQDLRISPRRIPAQPADRFVVHLVRRRFTR